MAIEFQCPECRATIRAPDDAAGKSSSCPKCRTKLIVPVVEIPAETTAPQLSADETSTDPLADIHTETAQNGDAAVPGFNAAQDKPSPTLQRLRHRRRQQMPTWLIPVAFGGIILAAIVFFYWETQPELVGTAKGEVVTEPVFRIQKIPRQSIDVEKQTMDTVLQDLEQQAHVYKTPQITCILQGDAEGLKIQLEQAPRTVIVRVSLRSKLLLRDFLLKHRHEFSKIKQSSLDSALQDFYIAFEAAIKDNKPVDDSLRYFYDIGLNTQVGELGYYVRARYANKIYHCIYEDDQGIYFALPEHATQFQIVGRKLDNGQVLLPVKYDVSISNSVNEQAKQ